MHRRFLGPLAFAAAALMAVPCAGQAPPSRQPQVSGQTYFISGSVRDEVSGQVLERVQVDLGSFGGATISSAFTGGNGAFEFRGLRSGDYYINVNLDGYEPVRERVEILNSSRPGIVLFLRKPLAFGKPAVTAPTISARELALPSAARSAYESGMEKLYSKRDPKASLKYFRKVIEKAPDFYEAYYQLGVAYDRQQQPREAEEALRQSIDLSKNSFADPQIALAALLSNQLRFAEAESPARQGLALNPNAWQGYFELSRALLGLNRLEEAGKAAEETLARNPRFAPVHLVLADLHIRQRNYQALLQDLDEYLKLEPHGPYSEAARQKRGIVARALQQTEKRTAPSPPQR